MARSTKQGLPTRHIFLAPGNRKCSRCCCTKPVKDGEYRAIDRLHQRWYCAGCKTKL